MKILCQLHKLEWSLPKRQLSIASNRSNSGRKLWACHVIIPRFILWIQSNSYVPPRFREYYFYNVFRVSEGKFLGFMITRRRIEANPAQIKTILEFPSPTSRKKVQQFSRRLATLGRFISRFTNHLCLLFNTLRRGKVNRMDPWMRIGIHLNKAIFDPTSNPYQSKNCMYTWSYQNLRLVHCYYEWTKKSSKSQCTIWVKS